MITVSVMSGSYFIGDTIVLKPLDQPTRDLATRQCQRCEVYFTGPAPIVRGMRGETVVVCPGCKEVPA